MYPFLVHQQTRRSLAAARDFMRHTYGCPVRLPDVSARAHLSPYHFLRLHKEAYGETPHEFLTRLRVERAKALLARGSHSVTEACFEVGFSSLGSFSAMFTRRVGLSPSEYRRHARSGVLVPRSVRPLFVPGCFAAMFFGAPPADDSNIREAERAVPPVSSR